MATALSVTSTSSSPLPKRAVVQNGTPSNPAYVLPFYDGTAVRYATGSSESTMAVSGTNERSATISTPRGKVIAVGGTVLHVWVSTGGSFGQDSWNGTSWSAGSSTGPASNNVLACYATDSSHFVMAATQKSGGSGTGSDAPGQLNFWTATSAGGAWTRAETATMTAAIGTANDAPLVAMPWGGKALAVAINSASSGSNLEYYITDLVSAPTVGQIGTTNISRQTSNLSGLVDGNGYAWLVYNDGAGLKVRTSTATSGTLAWSAAQSITSTVSGDTYPVLFCDGAGDVWLYYVRSSDHAVVRIKMSWDGTTFTQGSATAVNTPASAPTFLQVVQQDAGYATLCWVTGSNPYTVWVHSDQLGTANSSTLTGSLGSMAGSMLRTAKKQVNGSLGSMSGAMARFFQLGETTFSAALNLAGPTALLNLVKKQVNGSLGSMSGTLRLTYAFARTVFAATLTLTPPSGLTNLVHKQVNGSLGQVAGSLKNSVHKQVNGSLGTVGGSLRNAIHKQVNGSLGTVGGLLTDVYQPASHLFQQTLTATFQLTATAQQYGGLLLGTGIAAAAPVITNSGSFTIKTLKQVNGSLGQVGGALTALKLRLQVLAATLQPAGTLNRTTLRSFAVTLTATPALLRTALKSLPGATLQAAATMTRRVTHGLAATLQGSGVTTTILNGGAHAYSQVLFATMALAGAVQKQVRPGLFGSLGAIGGALGPRALGKALTTTLAWTGALVTPVFGHVNQVALTATLALSGSWSRFISKTMNSALRLATSFAFSWSFPALLARYRFIPGQDEAVLLGLLPQVTVSPLSGTVSLTLDYRAVAPASATITAMSMTITRRVPDVGVPPADVTSTVLTGSSFYLGPYAVVRLWSATATPLQGASYTVSVQATLSNGAVVSGTLPPILCQ